tara:strand:+ start:29807 stop:29956 length:150 start_codon:yes stop_codon:yes gene_type:complete
MNEREQMLEKQRYFYSRKAKHFQNKYRANKFAAWCWFLLFVIHMVAERF